MLASLRSPDSLTVFSGYRRLCLSLSLGEVLAFPASSGYRSRMSIDQIAGEALRLPPSERALLAESLWESLSDPFEGVEADEAATIQLALERDRQIETGEVQAISHEELLARLRR